MLKGLLNFMLNVMNGLIEGIKNSISIGIITFAGGLGLGFPLATSFIAGLKTAGFFAAIYAYQFVKNPKNRRDFFENKYVEKKKTTTPAETPSPTTPGLEETLTFGDNKTHYDKSVTLVDPSGDYSETLADLGDDTTPKPDADKPDEVINVHDFDDSLDGAPIVPQAGTREAGDNTATATIPEIKLGNTELTQLGQESIEAWLSQEPDADKKVEETKKESTISLAKGLPYKTNRINLKLRNNKKGPNPKGPSQP